MSVSFEGTAGTWGGRPIGLDREMANDK